MDKSPRTSITSTKPIKNVIIGDPPVAYVHRQIISLSYKLSSSQLKQSINSINASTDERMRCKTTAQPIALPPIDRKERMNDADQSILTVE